MNNLKIKKGIIIPLSLIKNENLTLNEVLSFSIIMHFNNDKFTINKNRPYNPKLPEYYIDTEDLFRIIPLDKRIIKKTLNNLINLNYVSYFKSKNIPGNITNLISYNKNYKKEGFIYIPIEVLYNNKLSLLNKFLLSYIRSFNLKFKQCFTKTKILSELFKTSERNINRYLNKLNNLNLIEINKEGNNRSMNINQLNIDNYFKDADIREIREARIEKAKIDKINNSKINKVDNINKVNNITEAKINNAKVDNIENQTNIININLLNLDNLSRADLLSIKKTLDSQLINLINNK